MAFWVTCKIAQPIQPIWQHIFALPWSALKEPPWEFNFFHIFGIPSSSRHEKHCQMLQTPFWLFQCSKNPRCNTPDGQQIKLTHSQCHQYHWRTLIFYNSPLGFLQSLQKREFQFSNWIILVKNVSTHFEINTQKFESLETPQLLFFCAYKIQGDNKQPEKSTFWLERMQGILE